MLKQCSIYMPVIALWVLALPVKAEEKVWYCETIEHIYVSEDGITEGLERGESGRFRFSSTVEKVAFGSTGLFRGLDAPMVEFEGHDDFFARQSNRIITFRNGIFIMTVTFHTTAYATSARCEEF